jgi:transcriptional regulator with XRE-family HTH domain
VPEESPSAIRRWQISQTLRKLREDAGLTHEQVINKLGKWSPSKLSRIENGVQGIRSQEADQLLDLYQVTDHNLRSWLLGLASAPRERGWAQDIRKHLPKELHQFLDWEVALVACRQFETLLVPGLLQTPEYARALVAGIRPDLAEEDIEKRVMARVARQQILTRPTPPRLHIVLDVGVLERPVGSPQIMRGQLHRLIEVAREPHITIQVLPKSVGASPALEGPFSILTLPDPVPEIGFAESPGAAAYFENREDVQKCAMRFGILTAQALPEASSVKLITDAANAYD